MIYFQPFTSTSTGPGSLTGPGPICCTISPAAQAPARSAPAGRRLPARRKKQPPNLTGKLGGWAIVVQVGESRQP